MDLLRFEYREILNLSDRSGMLKLGKYIELNKENLEEELKIEITLTTNSYFEFKADSWEETDEQIRKLVADFLYKRKKELVTCGCCNSYFKKGELSSYIFRIKDKVTMVCEDCRKELDAQEKALLAKKLLEW